MRTALLFSRLFVKYLQAIPKTEFRHCEERSSRRSNLTHGYVQTILYKIASLRLDTCLAFARHYSTTSSQ